MIDHEIRCHWKDLERGAEQDTLLGFSAKNDLEFDAEIQAALVGARYGVMPRRRGRSTWAINEPGEFQIRVYARKIEEAFPDG